MKQIAIYGAQMVAVGVYYAIKALYKDCRVTEFIVSGLNGNPSRIDGIPVLQIKDFQKRDRKILIAAPENHHREIIKRLEEKKLTNYVCIDSRTEAKIMEQFYKNTPDFKTLSSLQPGKEKVSLSVYLSKFYKDQPLETEEKFPKWVYPIQAGTALTTASIAELHDNKGDNISIKNVNYSELTAMYWIWKHIDNDYIGFFHYRRILDVTEQDLCRIKNNDVDVVLPYPTIHYPNILEHHKRYLSEDDWNAMKRALQELYPEYALALPHIFSRKYFFNYNILIAKNYIFKDYCNWMFKILEKTEELSTPKGSERADRYIGYLGENLTTLYFMYHQKDYKTVLTGRKMLI